MPQIATKRQQHSRTDTHLDFRATIWLFALAVTISVFLAIGSAKAERPLSEGLVYETLGKLAPWHEDINEDQAARRQRLASLSRAVVAVSLQYERSEDYQGTAKEMAASLITAAWWESRLNSRIQRGNCKKGECDGGTSKSIYQVKPRRFGGIVPNELWDEIDRFPGPSSDLLATRAAAIVISANRKACFGRFGATGMWSAYLIGKCQGGAQAKIRARWMGRIARRLER